MLAHRNFHYPLFLLEVLETQAALLLLCHVGKRMCIVGLFRRDSPVLYSVHNFEVDADDRLGFLIEGLIVVKLAVIVETVGLARLAAPALAISEEKANHLHQQDHQE